MTAGTVLRTGQHARLFQSPLQRGGVCDHIAVDQYGQVMPEGFNPLFSGEGSVTAIPPTKGKEVKTSFNPLFSGEGSVTGRYLQGDRRTVPVSIPSSAGRGL